MNRSPLFYPLNRGMDSEAGGAAELQTDVMRFMAIISLCLVAIFALVQSMPMMPTLPAIPEPERAEPVSEQPVTKPKPTPTPTPTPALVETRIVEPEPVKPIEPRRAEPATAAEPTPAATPMPPADDPQEDGFTLRFENNAALTRLVGSDAIGLYAIAPDKTQKMQTDHGRVSFTIANTPQQFHEMEQSTVPGSVLQAFRRTGSLPPSAVRWGVTLSSDMTQSLTRFLGAHKGGDLVIHADGQLRLGN